MTQQKLIRWFETLSLEDVALVGGKNASLGEAFLPPKAFKVRREP